MRRSIQSVSGFLFGGGISLVLLGLFLTDPDSSSRRGVDSHAIAGIVMILVSIVIMAVQRKGDE